MIIACPACATRYAVPDDAIGIEGRTVRCAKCRHSWFQEGAALETAPARTQPPAAPPSVEDQAEEKTQAAAPEPEIPVPEKPVTDSPPDSIEDVGSAPSQDEDSYSAFDHTAPFRPRRNVAKLLMIAAVLFATVVLGATVWVWRYGLPGWVPATSATFAEAQPELVLDFPPNRQDRRTLANGTEFFGASGTVTNVGAAERSLPSILIVMRDARERIVYRWEVVPPKRRLGPGESVTINEAVTDVPKSAVAAEIGWKPG